MVEAIREPKFNRVWLERGYRTSTPYQTDLPLVSCRAYNPHSPHESAQYGKTTFCPGKWHFTEEQCRDSGSHKAHLHGGKLCNGHSFDYT